MNIEQELEKVWKQDYINELPSFIKERGFVFCENSSTKDILLTGINPSFRNGECLNSFGFDFQKILFQEKWDNYWGPVRKMLYDTEMNIDLRSRTSYLDIFYYREQEQKRLRKEILKNQNGIRFLVEQLAITQRIIEEIIKPKLIIVKNKESAAYWGKMSAQGVIWMGYQLNYIKNLSCGELYRISGLINSKERIFQEINKTNLKGSYILFTQHINQFTKRENKPTASLIKDLLENKTYSN